MKRCVALVVALAAAAACGDDRKKMVAGIDEWGVRWQNERECLLGADPVAKDAREAFMVRSVIAGSGRLLVDGCLTNNALLRDSEARVDDQSVEATWQDLNSAVESLLKTRRELASGNEEVMPSMARRIAAVDSIYERLRKRAGMNPVVLPGTPLPDEPLGVVIGASSKTSSFRSPILFANAVTVFQTTDGVESIAAYRSARDVDRYPLTDVFPAAGDEAWGVRVVSGPKWHELQLIDGTVIAREPARAVIRIEPHFATGNGDNRVVVYEVRGALRTRTAREQYMADDEEWPPAVMKVVASSGGAWNNVLTAEGVGGSYAIEPYVYADWPHRRADIVWGDEQRHLYWATVQDGALQAPARRPAGVVSHYYNFDPVACFGARHAWVLSDKKLWFSGGDDAPAVDVPRYVHAEAQVKCNDSLLVRSWSDDGGTSRAQHCTREGCSAARAAEVEGSMGLGRDGVMLTAFIAHGVMFAKLEGKPARALWRANPSSIIYGVLDGVDDWYVVLTTIDELRLAPLGLR